MIRSPLTRVATLALAALLGGALLQSPSATEAATAPPTVQPGEFTFAVIPDTQGYVNSDVWHPTAGVQTQWLVNNRDNLNLKFVAQVGDLVESWPNVTQWQRISGYMATLDAAGVPNAVLPGNHDMDVSTGAAPRYDEYFPPSRYSAKPWYGGYLGQNLFGPDPIDRKNKDSFSLFSAGGLDFLVLSLEYDAPDYALQWAQKVLNAYPDRRVILSTHSFIHTGGARSTTTTRTDGANTPAQIWTKFVYGNCNIFMVVNGHWHDGDLGEARRSDPNACGEPVQQILANYQERANGGNGWMRWYTFKPVTNQIQAVTYSPTLDVYDTGPLASFTFGYDMSTTGVTKRTLVPGASTWKWRYATGAWPSGWTSSTFDDSTWKQGSAVLGFGTTVATNIDVPAPTSNRPISAQFRKTFTVTDPSALSNVLVTTRANDGVVVFVNGTEVGRANLPSTTLSSTSYATAAPRVSTAPSLAFTVPASLLRAGTNVVTASTHLNYRATPDVTFDLVLTAEESSDPPPPTPPPAPVVTGSATGPTAVTLDWPAIADVTEYRVARDGVARGSVTAPTHTFSESGLTAETTYNYSVVAVGTNGLQSQPGTASVTTPPTATNPPTATTLIATGSQWRWRYQTGAWPTGWTAASFDASTWNLGNAVLGFGSTLATNIDVPAPTTNRPLSAQFRQTFSVANPAALSQLSITTRGDDGVVVYVNGTEVGRSRMPTGTLSSTSYATAAPRTSTAGTVTFAVPTSLLVAGTNVVSVSTHLNYRATPDISFDLTLKGMTTAP